MDIRNKNIVVVIAHPDDETIGCGGFLSKASIQNANCRVVLPVRRGDARGISNWDRLIDQLANASKLLGATLVLTDDLVDDLTAEIYVHKIYKLIEEHVAWADIVLTHWHGDSHQAHRAVSRAVELATRPFRSKKTVLFFEIATSTDQAYEYTFSPNCFVVLSDTEVANKISAMNHYGTEIIAGRTPENLKNQLRLRGSQIGSDFAEAFVIARHFIE